MNRIKRNNMLNKAEINELATQLRAMDRNILGVAILDLTECFWYVLSKFGYYAK